MNNKGTDSGDDPGFWDRGVKFDMGEGGVNVPRLS